MSEEDEEDLDPEGGEVTIKGLTISVVHKCCCTIKLYIPSTGEESLSSQTVIWILLFKLTNWNLFFILFFRLVKFYQLRSSIEKKSWHISLCMRTLWETWTVPVYNGIITSEGKSESELNGCFLFVWKQMENKAMMKEVLQTWWFSNHANHFKSLQVKIDYGLSDFL